MTNDINFWTGIKDPYLKPDKPFLTEDKELKIIHLIQSYPMHCPLCGQLMRHNGSRKKPVTIKILSLAGKPAVLKSRNNSISVHHHPNVPSELPRSPRSKELNSPVELRMSLNTILCRNSVRMNPCGRLPTITMFLLTPLSASSKTSRIPLRLILTGYRQLSLLMTLNPVSSPKVR